MFFQEEIETCSREELDRIQDERLVCQVNHLWNNVKFYKAKMEKLNLYPDDIKGKKDLYKLPFLDKDDLKDTYPYGLFAVDKKDCVRIQSTSGTTGKRVIAGYTARDVDIWEECCARALATANVDSDNICQIAYGYGLFTGGAGLHGGSHKLGSMTVPMSSGNTDRQIQFMIDLGSTFLCCTPSYAAYLAECIEEAGALDKIKLKGGIFGAEP